MMVSSRVEATGRFEQLHAWSVSTDPQLRKLADTQGNQLGGGVNVYLNGHSFKIQTDYFAITRHDFGGPQHVIRTQLDASF